MPGTIKVSVLEAVDLPEVLTDGPIGKDVTAKVTLGPRMFKTQPGVADGGRIASWNSDFAFPVMNLRDKLVISICDSEDHSVTQTAIEIPSIIQKGSRDEFVALNKGGRIHLRMSFVLTDDERKKIETMRVAALKRKEEAERLKKTVIVQPVTPEKELKKSLIPTVAITEVDVSTTGDKNDLKEPAHGPLDDRKDSTIAGDKKDATTTLKKSTPKPPAPKPMFNYAKAIGMPPGAKKTVKKPSAAVSDSSSIEPKADTSDVSSGEVVFSEASKLDASVEAPRSGDGDVPLVTKATPLGSLIPAGKSDNVSNEVKANKGEVNSEVQTGRVSSENADELRDTKLGGAAPLETRPADSVAQSNLPPTEVESGVAENLTSEAEEANKDGTDSEAQAVRESAEEVGTKLESSAVESLMIAPAGNASRGQVLQLSIRSFPSGPISLKARVKRTLSRVSSRRSSSRVARSDSLTRTPPPVPVVWVQEAVRRALSNVKECYGLNPSTVNH